MFTPLNAPGSMAPDALVQWAQENFADLERVLKNVGRRQQYNPTFTAAGGSPAIGNGTIVGAFSEFGSWLVATVQFTVGGTTNLGTGLLSVSLPRIPVPVDPRWAGVVHLLDASTGTEYAVGAKTSITAALLELGTMPVTLAAGDRLIATVGYPVE